MNEKATQEPQDQTDTIDNGANTSASADSTEEVHMSEDSAEEVHTSELSPAEQEYIDDSNDIGTLITEIQTVNQRLDTMTNCSGQAFL